MDNWKHRSENMECRTCMYFVEKGSICNTERPQDMKASVQADAFIGRCRKHAPVMNGFPVVFESDWCGDHKIDENKL